MKNRMDIRLLLLYTLFNHPHLLIQVARCCLDEWVSSLLIGIGRLLSTLLSIMFSIAVLTNEV